MSDRRISLLVVDKDPIFRLGLATVLRNDTQWNVITETDSLKDALARVSDNAFSLVILDTNVANKVSEIEEFKQKIKDISPKTKLCLLSESLSFKKRKKLKKIGIEGYCNKGISTEFLIKSLEKIEQGQLVWSEVSVNHKSRNNWLFSLQQSGIEQMEIDLENINKRLKKPLVSKLDRLFWQGRKRELLTARWLVENLLPVEVIMISDPVENSQTIPAENLIFQGTIVESDIHSSLLNKTIYNVKNNLENLSKYTLEIDILKTDKKQEILQLVLKQFNRIINDIKFIESPQTQTSKTSLSILERLWRESTLVFLSKYCVDNRLFYIEDIEILVEEKEALVSSEILEKIPFFTELLDFIILGNEVNADFANLRSLDKEDKILHNVIIQVANAVVSLILNYFSENKKIKENLYNDEMASSREIAKFRNRLAWEYRKKQYWQEPKNIFESKYEIFCFKETGIHCTSIKISRKQELKRLQGLPWTVTILLESRDAISPLLQSVVGTVGQGLVYILTQVIGRGIGLVGRGILQGIGKSLSEKDFPKNSAQQHSKGKSKS